MKETKINNSVKWWQIVIILISIIGIGASMIAFGYYPKSEGKSLETRVTYIEKQFEEDISDIKIDIREIKEFILKEK